MKDKKINNVINHPAHYTDGKIEVIDFVQIETLNFPPLKNKSSPLRIMLWSFGKYDFITSLAIHINNL